jgi:hypothetical protein
MICPDTNDVKNSTVVQYDGGYSNNLFNLDYTPKVQVCQPNASSHVSIKGIEKSKITLLNVFPNPTSGITNVTFETEDVNSTTLNIYNSIGKLVESLPLQNNVTFQKIELNTQNYEAGIYNIQINIGESSYSKKLTVIK